MVHGERLLLVEDDAATREVLGLLLAGEGWSVDAVESGEAALAAVASGAVPAVVLCDLHLPGVCGEALAQGLRRALPAEAVLLGMTASTKASGTGYDGVLLKPFPPDATEASWRVVLRNRVPGQAEAGALQPVGSEGIGVRGGPSLTKQDAVQESTAGEQVDDVPVLDLATMERLRKAMGDAGVRGLYAFALGDAGDRMGRMEAAVETGDAALFVREAHALKGSCSMIGARAMARLASDAEMEGLDVGSDDKVSRLRVATEAVRLMLETLFPV